MSEHGIHALDELRESLREAARRDIAAKPRRRRSPRRIGGLAAVLVVLAGGAAATAADLISAGAPLPDDKPISSRYLPMPGGLVQIAVQATDKPLAWGVGVYTSNNGEECAMVGQVRGASLGLVEGRTFRGFSSRHGASCGRLRPLRTPVTLSFYRGQNRSVLFGLAGTGTKRVTATVDGKSYTARTGASGAFVFVFKGESVTSAAVVGD